MMHILLHDEEVLCPNQSDARGEVQLIIGLFHFH